MAPYRRSSLSYLRQASNFSPASARVRNQWAFKHSARKRSGSTLSSGRPGSSWCNFRRCRTRPARIKNVRNLLFGKSVRLRGLAIPGGRQLSGNSRFARKRRARPRQVRSPRPKPTEFQLDPSRTSEIGHHRVCGRAEKCPWHISSTDCWPIKPIAQSVEAAAFFLLPQDTASVLPIREAARS